MTLTSPYGGSSWLPQKPLEAAIGQVFAPYCPGGRQGLHADKKNDEKASYLPAVLLVVAVRRYDTKRIAQWRGTRATPEATGCHHWANIAADRMNRSRKSQFFPSIFIVDPLKRGLG